MTLSLRAGFALLATTAVLAGCSTAPTITVPNPLAALNGAFTPAPRVAAVPTYQSAPGMYQQVAPANYGTIVPSYTSMPSYGTASYGAVDQGYSVSSVDTGAYSLDSVAPSYSNAAPMFDAPSYSAASSFDQGTYTLGSVASAPATASYSSGVPMLGTLDTAAPSYSMAAPVMETASYAPSVPMLGGSSTMAAPTPSFTQSYGALQPVQASGTTYDLTGSSMMESMEMMDPAAGLTVDSGYSTYEAPATSMGGSFQVVNPAMSTGVATYSTAPTVVDSGTFTY